MSDRAAFPAPTLIVAGRRDSTAGYADAAELLEHYPRATLAVIEDAGHALMHERPDLLAALLGDWLARSAAAPGAQPEGYAAAKPRFAVEQRPLHVDAPGEAAERPVAAQHPVARHEERRRVARADGCRGPHRARRPERRGEARCS